MEWKTEDLFKSNYGKGPLVSRILSETPKYLEMEYWNGQHKRPHRKQFKLSAKLLFSPRCGWKKVRKSNLREVQRIDRQSEFEANAAWRAEGQEHENSYDGY